MPRARFIASLLAVVLLVAGCGGGEEDASEEPEGTRTDGVSEVTRDDDDQPDTTVRDSAEQTDQPDADAEPEPLLVRLGDRFPVCADVQAKWDAFDGSQAALQTAEAAYQNAVSAHAAATDELDRAEARDALRAAERTLSEARDRYDSAEWQEVHNNFGLGHHWHLSGGDDSESTVYARAWAAFIDSADPSIVEAVHNYETATARDEATRAAVDAVTEQVRSAVDAAEVAADEAHDAYRVAARLLSAALRSLPEQFTDLAAATATGKAAAEAAYASGGDAATAAAAAYEAAHEAAVDATSRFVDGLNDLLVSDTTRRDVLAERRDAFEEAVVALEALGGDASRTYAANLAVARRAEDAYWAAEDTLAQADVDHGAALADLDALRFSLRSPGTEAVSNAATSPAIASLRSAVNTAWADHDEASLAGREAKDAYERSRNEGLADDAGYAAFRNSIRESCQ